MPIPKQLEKKLAESFGGRFGDNHNLLYYTEEANASYRKWTFAVAEETVTTPLRLHFGYVEGYITEEFDISIDRSIDLYHLDHLRYVEAAIGPSALWESDNEPDTSDS